MSAIDARAQQIATVTTNSWNNADLHVEGTLDKPTSAMLDIVGYDANQHEVAHSEGFDGADGTFNVVLSDPQKRIRFVKAIVSQLFVNDKADADATHIYFGPSNSVLLIIHRAFLVLQIELELFADVGCCEIRRDRLKHPVQIILVAVLCLLRQKLSKFLDLRQEHWLEN